MKLSIRREEGVGRKRFVREKEIFPKWRNIAGDRTLTLRTLDQGKRASNRVNSTAIPGPSPPLHYGDWITIGEGGNKVNVIFLRDSFYPATRADRRFNFRPARRIV